MTLQIFRTKSIDALLAQTERQGASLKKVLGPASLIALGVGAIIGTGIFATIGTASAGDASRPGAGPALMVSFVLTAVVCSFTALCYAEFASMVPAAGSAYTYAYATLGELAAWIIGWDLLLEYAIGNTAVAISWAGYADALLRGLGLQLPRWLVTDYRTAASSPGVLAHAPHVFGVPVVFNALAMGIVAFVTIVLVWGVKESARLNAVMVGVKLVVLAFFVLVCARFVRLENWHPFAPNGFAGIGAGAAVIFFAYIGFDAVSTCAEECKEPGSRHADRHHRVAPSLHGHLRDRGGRLLGSRAVPGAREARSDAPRRGARRRDGVRRRCPTWAVGVVSLGSVVAQTAVLLVFQLGQPRILFAMARDGLLPPVFARVHPKFGTPHVSTILTGVLVGVVSAFASIDEMVDLTNIGTLFAFILVCTGISIMRFREPNRVRPFRVPLRPAGRADPGRRVVPRARQLPTSVVVDAVRRVVVRRAGPLCVVRVPAVAVARERVSAGSGAWRRLGRGRGRGLGCGRGRGRGRVARARKKRDRGGSPIPAMRPGSLVVGHITPSGVRRGPGDGRSLRRDARDGTRGDGRRSRSRRRGDDRCDRSFHVLLLIRSHRVPHRPSGFRLRCRYDLRRRLDGGHLARRVPEVRKHRACGLRVPDLKQHVLLDAAQEGVHPEVAVALPLHGFEPRGPRLVGVVGRCDVLLDLRQKVGHRVGDAAKGEGRGALFVQ